MYQMPVDGRNTAASFFPSPSYSPGTGISPVRPHCRNARLPVLELRTYQMPVDGL